MCVHLAFYDFFKHDGFLFKGKRLCMQISSIKQLQMKEAHENGCIEMLNFLFTPFPIPTSPWIDISMDIILDFPRSKGGRNSIFVVVDRFSKVTHFISCHKNDDALHDMVILHGIPRTLVSDRDTKFLGHFWKMFDSTTSNSPLKLAYDFNPLSPIDLLPLPILPNCVNDVRISKGKFVYLRKERFAHLRKSKLLPRRDDPFKILNKINDNVYKVDVLRIWGKHYL
ncbi:hypothetical protein CR513_10958, partial [Mucuna pruriens]